MKKNENKNNKRKIEFFKFMITGAAVPSLQAQPAGQVVAESIETHILMRLTSVVRSIGAQKGPVGISSYPLDQLQPVAIAQVGAVV